MTKPFTGWHVLAIFVSGFAVIISVNLTLAFNAVSTFPGLETRNPYVVSQNFELERAAQLALGWDVRANIDGDQLYLHINDDLGVVVPHIISATLGRATKVHDDQMPNFAHDGTAFVATITPLNSGNWNLRLIAQAADGTMFRQRIIVSVTQ